MAHGDSGPPLESTDGSSVTVKDGELYTRDRQLAILEDILLEVKRTNEYLEQLIEL